ncbi:MAG: MucB/RseB C-terminal domain-containing protein [Pseudomonadota bacterium]
MRLVIISIKFYVALMLLWCSASVGAETQDPILDRREVQALLKKIQTAAQQLNYSGTFVYQQASRMRTSRITHLKDGRNEIAKLEILDGKPREYIRINEEITCYLPEIKTIQIEKRESLDVFPAILAIGHEQLAEQYSIRKDSGGRVAGFECDGVTLEPRDNLRYGYRLWADKSTGLLLKAQTLNERNEVVEQIAFTQLSIGDIDRIRAKPSFGNISGWHVENAMTSQISSSGWTVQWVPPGFKKIRELRRVVSDASNKAAASSKHEDTHREINQIVFSDGLAAISVFIEPNSANHTDGSSQQGAMNITGKRQGDYWLTIVGEVPAVAIKKVAGSIEFKPK